MDVGKVCTGKCLSVWNRVLPLDILQFSEVRCVEVVQLLGVAFVNRPGFTSVGRTTAMSTISLVSKLTSLLFQILACSRPKGALALANLAFTSTSMVTLRDSVLLR